MNILPKASGGNFVTQRLGKELLVYNLLTDKVYALNETSMIVFNACNGATTFDELKVLHNYTDEIIYLALDGLSKENLIEPNYTLPLASINRRKAIKKAGLASMIVLPLISSIVAPAAANAASTPVLRNQANGQTCSTAQNGSSRECQSGYCVQTSDGATRCCTKQSSEAGTPAPSQEILGPPVATCDQRIASNCCSGTRATQFGQLCVCN